MLIKLNDGESVTVMLNHVDEPHAFTLSNHGGWLGAREFHRPKEQEESPATDTQQANYEICPKCGGSGRVYMCAEDGDGIKCHKCSGSGKLS